jgi:hypothetical protein
MIARFFLLGSPTPVLFSFQLISAERLNGAGTSERDRIITDKRK